MPTDLDIHDLASVRRLSELQLNMHGNGKYHVDTDVGFWLLKENCPGVEHVQLWLSHMRCHTLATENQLVDLAWEGKAPPESEEACACDGCERIAF
jgi:hypothetical protein